MSLNAAALRLLAEKGLSAADIVELAEVLEVRRDPTAAARMRRYRAKKAGDEEGTVTVTRNVTPVTNDLPPNDIYSNPPTNPTGAKAPAVPFSEKVVEAWNAGPAARGATKARKLDTGRKRDLARRVKEHGEDGVLAAIRGIEISDFHCGIGPNAFTANLGWLLKNAEKFVAAMERSDSAKGATPSAKPMTSDDQRAYLAKLNGAPHLRGNATIDTPRSSGPPRSFAALAGGIASQVTVQ